MKKLSLLILASICMFNVINADNEVMTIYNTASYPINVGMQSIFQNKHNENRHSTTPKYGLDIAAREKSEWYYKGIFENVTVTNTTNMKKSSLDNHKDYYDMSVVIIEDSSENPGTPVIKWLNTLDAQKLLFSKGFSNWLF